MNPFFRIREAAHSDLAGLWPLAKRLNSYNLPSDRKVLSRLLKVSELSFRGALPKSQARYLFVMEQQPSGRIVGCSMIIAKHGTKELPHLWMRVKNVSHVSRTLGVTRRHTTLTLGSTTDGPTEVGGLVVLPDYRQHPQRLGLQLSYVRFLYMALYPQRFEPQVLVEYLPPLTDGGSGSPLWEALGRHFTGLSYRQADRLSITNKEFVLSLFPRTPIYTTFFPEGVRTQLGVVHTQALGACAMLKRAGFRYLDEIEPFDGGPYYGAARQKISIVRSARRGVVRPVSRLGKMQKWLLGTQAGSGRFRAVAVDAGWSGSRWQAEPSVLRTLDLPSGGAAIGTSLER